MAIVYIITYFYKNTAKNRESIICYGRYRPRSRSHYTTHASTNLGGLSFWPHLKVRPLYADWQCSCLRTLNCPEVGMGRGNLDPGWITYIRLHRKPVPTGFLKHKAPRNEPRVDNNTGGDSVSATQKPVAHLKSACCVPGAGVRGLSGNKRL